MPNRVLRDWTDSETIASVSEQAEILFVRLIMKADDHGCFYGNPALIKGILFPLRGHTEKQIEKWLSELSKANIIQLYEVSGRIYLKITNFNQRLRLMQSKFPQPETGQIHAPSFDGQLSVNCRPETKRSRNEVETETKSEDACGAVSVWPTFGDFWETYGKKVDKPKTEKKWNTINQGAREKIMQHLELYVRGTPDVQYRKNPLTYLNNESWNNEVITKTTSNGITAQGTLDRLNSYSN